jgi:hypothetical protein
VNAPLIHGTRRTLSASAMLDIIGADLIQIRHEDGLTWSDMGRVLGKSEDQAAKYADGSAEMGVVAYLFARREWGTRITGRVQALVDGNRSRIADAQILPDVLEGARGLSVAISDGKYCLRDIRQNRKEIEETISACYSLLSKLDEEIAA